MHEKKMKIMVPVDFTRHTDKLVKYALQMGRTMAAEITFVHIVESFSGYEMLLVHPSFEKISADLKARADELMANLVEDNKSEFENISGQVMIGDTVDKLVEYADNGEFDLIIIGTHGARGLEKVLMGSVAGKLTQNAPCPILILNPAIHLTRK